MPRRLTLAWLRWPACSQSRTSSVACYSGTPRGGLSMRLRQEQRPRQAVVYECERRLRINASADTVWCWMADVRHLLRLNIFHAAVEYPEPVMQAGLQV